MHIDRTDREAGTQRERETADSWLAKQTDRQQTSPHLHILPNLTSYIFTSWHLLIFTSSHLHIHLHIFSSSHFSSSHLLIFTPSKISSHLHILTSSSPRRSAEPSPEPKWTPGIIHRYYDQRGSGIWTFQPRKSSKSGPPQVDKQPAPRTQTSASALTGRGCQCAVLNVLLFQPPLRALPQSLLGQERISGHVRPWLAPPPPPILLSSHLPEDCIWEKAICQKNASEKKPSARRMTSEKRIKLEFNSSDTCPVGWKLEKN